MPSPRLSAALACCLIAATSAVADAGQLAPADALARLKAGNARFVADPGAKPVIDRAEREALAAGQAPFAIVLSCADSRVPPELVFNEGIGDLFVIRTAGQVTDRAVLASVEYAAEHLHVGLIVVLGHESCGAVKATVDAKPGASMGPNLDYLVSQIKPAFARMHSPADAARMKEAILANVQQVSADLEKGSDILRHLAHEGKVKIVGAYYELASGQVTFAESTPHQQ